jgi:hypothetical protein
MWANHENYPKSESNFLSIVQYWIDHYFNDPQYQRIGGRPVVYIFSPSNLEQKARAFGTTTNNLLGKANAAAQQAGLPGIFFVGGSPAGQFARSDAKAYGYQALSAYNYTAGTKTQPFVSYQALDRGYQEQWDWILNNSSLYYFVPMSSGWDRRPWGGSPDPRRDLAFSTPDAFEAHLLAAKTAMDKRPGGTMGMGVICCWNEYGEGSYIEPTKTFQLQYLERIKKVFGQ